MTCLIQITDLHLAREAGARHFGVCVRDSLAKVLEQVRRTRPDCARIVLTGDLAHDEARETYAALRELLGDLVGRCLLLPGNHDDRSQIAAVFPDRVQRSGDRLCFVDEVEGWRLIGLDTQVPAKGWGVLGDEQLEWLARTLRGRGPTVLFLHHPPVPVASYWIDRVGLRDAHALQRVLAGAAQVRLICHGHTHQLVEARFADIDVRGTPSSCFQFRPGSLLPRLDRGRAPGWRVIELDGESLRTHVQRLNGPSRLAARI